MHFPPCKKNKGFSKKHSSSPAYVLPIQFELIRSHFRYEYGLSMDIYGWNDFHKTSDFCFFNFKSKVLESMIFLSLKFQIQNTKKRTVLIFIPHPPPGFNNLNRHLHNTDNICVLREAHWVLFSSQCAVMHIILYYIILYFFNSFYRKIQCVLSFLS